MKKKNATDFEVCYALNVTGAKGVTGIYRTGGYGRLNIYEKEEYALNDLDYIPVKQKDRVNFEVIKIKIERI